MSWSNHTETIPEESGYYFTYYTDRSTGKSYYKCIYWSVNEEKWISWRKPPELGGNPHLFTVHKFVKETRDDFYCPCVEKAEKMKW